MELIREIVEGSEDKGCIENWGSTYTVRWEEEQELVKNPAREGKAQWPSISEAKGDNSHQEEGSLFRT